MTHEDRVWHHEMETLEGIHEHAERIASLEELVADMWACISHIGEYDVFYYDMAKDGCGMSCTVNGEHCCADKLYDRIKELEVPL